MKVKDMSGMFIAMALVFVVAIGGILYASGNFSVTGNDSDDIIAPTRDSEFCANNPSLDAELRLEDSLADTKTYVDGTVYVQDMETGAIEEHAVASSDGSFVTLSDVFVCGSEGYKIFVKSDGSINSDGVIEIEASDLAQDPVRLGNLPVSQYTAFKVKAYDNFDKTKAKSTADNSSDYVTTATSSFGANSGVGYFSGASADPIDIEFTLAPVTQNRAKGEGLIIAINTEDESNLADFDEQLSIVEWNGKQLSEATGLSENELRALNSYEHIFVIPDTVGADADGDVRSMSTLRVYLESEAGESSIDFDPVIKIIALGDFESQETDDVLVNVGFKDDSSRTELVTAQTITVVVN